MCCESKNKVNFWSNDINETYLDFNALLDEGSILPEVSYG